MHTKTHTSQVCLDTHWGPLYVGHSTWGILLCYSCVLLCSTARHTQRHVHTNKNTCALTRAWETSHKHSACAFNAHTHTAEEIGTDSSIFSSAIVRRRTNSTIPPNTSHRSDIQHDISFKKKKKKKEKRNESSTLELAGSVECYHIELHGCAVSGFLGILALASGE